MSASLVFTWRRRARAPEQVAPFFTPVQTATVAASAEETPKRAKRLSMALNRLHFWVFLSRILGHRPIDNVSIFCREIGMVVAAATGDRTRIGWAPRPSAAESPLARHSPPGALPRRRAATGTKLLHWMDRNCTGPPLASRPRKQLS
ncbi:hypothetical protein [Bradyrhizobium yuanmingense]|uniref:hypothetical protein n=1 Tax=Bradyrhizobium yuanmingense TaxID=108015 RepID=UPI003CC637BC